MPRPSPRFAPFLFTLALAGCANPEPTKPVSSASAAPSASAAAPAFEEERVLATARACAQRPPFDGRGVGGSPLRLAEASVARRPSSGAPATWIVHIPEETRRSLPTGRDMIVNTTTGACGMAPMD